MLAATPSLPPAGGAAVPLGVLGSAAAPAGAPDSPCSDARSLFMRVVTRTAFCGSRKDMVGLIRAITYKLILMKALRKASECQE